MRKKTRFIIECRCGCGELIETPDKYCRERRYKKGHHHRGISRPWMAERNKKRRKPHTFIDGVEGKTCPACKEWKSLGEFGDLQSAHDGKCRRCKECLSKKALKYYHAHSNEIAKKRKTPEYREKYNAYWREYRRKKWATDVNFRLKARLRTSLRSAIKRNTKTGRTLDLLGCTVGELRQHLESQFQEGMVWNNWGQNGWHIDHIVPCAAFDFRNTEHQRRCFHYTNLQPLWAEDNLAKSDTIPEGIII